MPERMTDERYCLLKRESILPGYEIATSVREAELWDALQAERAEVERLRATESGDLFHERQMRQAAKARAERLENRWISVDQRLPDTQKMVLCYMPVAYNGQIHYGWLNQDLDFRGNPSKKTWREHSHNAYAHAMEDPLFTGTDASKVTHWMPRPEPPAQEKGE